MKTKSLIFPEAILDQHAVVLGKTGAGKSSALRHMVEHLLAEKKRVCVIDPKGDWSGLKVSADGKSPGFPVILFGDFKETAGHPIPVDVPLNEYSGKHIAELVTSGNRPAVVGLRGWTVVAMHKFWVDFASTFFNSNEGEFYLVVDEVHNFAPKGSLKGREGNVTNSLHWTNRLLSEARGLGCVMLIASQRPQKVHNDTLTACETLIAMRVVHAADRGAIEDWIKGCGDSDVGKEVLGSLAGMDRGEAYVWSPEAKFGPTRLRFPMFVTFDSFAPPQLQAKVSQKTWDTVDLTEVREKLAAVIEKAKREDPRELQKLNQEAQRRIKDLERQLAAKPGAVASTPKIIYALKDGQIAAVEKLLAQISAVPETFREKLERATLPLKEALAKVSVNGHKSPNAIEVTRDGPLVTRRPVRIDVPRAPRPAQQRTESSANAGELSAPEQKILDTVLMLNTRGIVASRDSVARWLGIHPNGGRYGSNLAALRANDYLDGFTLTDKGNQQARPSATGIVEARSALKDDVQRRILDVLQEGPHTRDSLAEKLGIHPNGGRYGSNLAWMRTMGLIPERGTVELTKGAWR